MTTEAVKKILAEEGHVFDIGQIDLETKRLLARLCRSGEVVKERAYWPWITSGTCRKTLYRLP
jgi:hypothetical protein